jgi:uncharacterized protein (DUF2384 family)
MGRSQKLANRKTKILVDPSRTRVERLKVEVPPRDSREISAQSVAAHALATFGSPEKARHWMNRPNPLFQGKTPAQMIELDLIGVEAELVRIDHGVYM